MIVSMDVILGLSAVLFGIGIFGFLARRNIILMLVSVEVMLNAVNLCLAGFSRHLDDAIARGQVVALFVIAVAAAEVSVGLGLIIALNRNKPGAAVDDLTKLKW